MERPQIENFIPGGLVEAHREYSTAPGLFAYAQSLENYIDWILEQKESGGVKYGSPEIIGDVRNVFDSLTDKDFDFDGFYNGWIEGRIRMLGELKGIGKKTKHFVDYSKKPIQETTLCNSCFRHVPKDYCSASNCRGNLDPREFDDSDDPRTKGLSNG